MFSLATIQDLNRKAARESRRTGTLPVRFNAERYAAFQRNPSNPGFTIPHIGDRRPKGYTLVRELFVDTSGFGAPDEPALTLAQFAAEVKPGFAYALIACGQFQGYVGEFRVRAS